MTVTRELLNRINMAAVWCDNDVKCFFETTKEEIPAALEQLDEHIAGYGAGTAAGDFALIEVIDFIEAAIAFAPEVVVNGTSFSTGHEAALHGAGAVRGYLRRGKRGHVPDIPDLSCRLSSEYQAAIKALPPAGAAVGHGVEPPEMAVPIVGFDAEDEKILAEMAQSPLRLFALVDLPGSNKATGQRVNAMIDKGIACRPKGKNGGVQITSKGMKIAQEAGLVQPK